MSDNRAAMSEPTTNGIQPITIQPPVLSVTVRLDEEVVIFRSNDRRSDAPDLTSMQNEIVAALLLGSLGRLAPNQNAAARA